MYAEAAVQNYDTSSSKIPKCLPIYLQANHAWYESNTELLALKNYNTYGIILLNT